MGKKTEISNSTAIENALDAVQGTIGARILEALEADPASLADKRRNFIHRAFPIPREQCILWADAEFDLRPSGIVCTDRGVFIRSNVAVLPFSKKAKDAPPAKSTLYFYPWEEFCPEWFTGESAKANTALTVEPQCRDRFISACKTLAAREAEERAEVFYDPALPENHAETLAAKVAPISAAAVESAQSAIFIEQKSAVNNPGGHGELAEEAITVLDKLHGLDAVVVGRDNAKDGADRMISNDIFIQTKY
jgi:hypothetical protein